MRVLRPPGHRTRHLPRPPPGVDFRFGTSSSSAPTRAAASATDGVPTAASDTPDGFGTTTAPARPLGRHAPVRPAAPQRRRSPARPPWRRRSPTPRRCAAGDRPRAVRKGRAPALRRLSHRCPPRPRRPAESWERSFRELEGRDGSGDAGSGVDRPAGVRGGVRRARRVPDDLGGRPGRPSRHRPSPPWASRTDGVIPRPLDEPPGDARCRSPVRMQIAGMDALLYEALDTPLRQMHAPCGRGTGTRLQHRPVELVPAQPCADRASALSVIATASR